MTDYMITDRSLIEAAIKEIREWKVDKGGDDQVVLNLEAGLARDEDAVWPLIEMIKAAIELAQYASYAEITGGITINRPEIRKWCDRIFAIYHFEFSETHKGLIDD